LGSPPSWTWPAMTSFQAHRIQGRRKVPLVVSDPSYKYGNINRAAPSLIRTASERPCSCAAEICRPC
jgi:hypothetical protein